MRHSGLQGVVQRRLTGLVGDAIGAPPISAEKMLDPVYGDVVPQNGAEDRQLTSAELRAELRCVRDGTVVLHKLDCSIAFASPLGHVPFLATESSEDGHTLLQGRIRPGHTPAVVLLLLTHPLIGETLEAFFAEGASD